MKSIRDIYKIGRGPSSSHTMGPQAAAMRFAREYPKAAKYTVILYGSLAKTGKGHMTDTAILEILPATKTEIIKHNALIQNLEMNTLFKNSKNFIFFISVSYSSKAFLASSNLSIRLPTYRNRRSASPCLSVPRK